MKCKIVYNIISELGDRIDSCNREFRFERPREQASPRQLACGRKHSAVASVACKALLLLACSYLTRELLYVCICHTLEQVVALCASGRAISATWKVECTDCQIRNSQGRRTHSENKVHSLPQPLIDGAEHAGCSASMQLARLRQMRPESVVVRVFL